MWRAWGFSGIPAHSRRTRCERCSTRRRRLPGNLGMRLHFAPVRHADDLGRAFVTIEAERTDALFVFDSVMLFALRPQIVVLATKHRLPSMFTTGKSWSSAPS